MLFKGDKMFSSRSLPFIHFLLLYCTLHQSLVFPLTDLSYSHSAYDGYTLQKTEEYGEFSELVKHIEEEIACQEEYTESDPIKKGVFSKWTRKLKNWFLKRTTRLFKKCLKLSHCSNFEECAYTAARFKHKMDKVYNTGNIENLLSDFDTHVPKGEEIEVLENFKNRIRFYHENKHVKPRKQIAKGKMGDELKDIPFGAVIGGLEIFCGALIFVLPFPGCKTIGSAIAIDGGSRIASAMIEKHETTKQNDQKDQYK